MILLDFEVTQQLQTYFPEYESSNNFGFFSFYKKQRVRPEIIEKYGHLTDDGFHELTKDWGGELEFDEVYYDKIKVAPTQMVSLPICKCFFLDEYLDFFDSIGIHINIISSKDSHNKLVYVFTISVDNEKYKSCACEMSYSYDTRDDAFEASAKHIIDHLK